MKVYILILTVLFGVSCAAKPPVNNVVNEKIQEKNKLIAAKNEITELTSLAQKLEQHGRDMQSYRDSSGVESSRQCNLILEARRKETAELEARAAKLPDNYKNKLTPIISELNECISCATKDLNDCKEARASINQLIKELYP